MFRGVKSTQILTVLSFFDTTTMPAHHCVGVSTLAQLTAYGLVHLSLFDEVGVELFWECEGQMA